MARSLEKDYRGPSFDGKVLESSKSYYAEYLKRYPAQAEQLQLQQKLVELDEKISLKEQMTAAYYSRTNSPISANLYYENILSVWPASGAAKIAEQKLPEIKKQIALLQMAKKKKFNWKGLLL
jgi:outer membrane protein assembly factor BamD (BamD/ComL family)